MEGAYTHYDFTLQNGATLQQARLVYKTHGELNARRDNAILFPTWFCAHHHQLEWLIGQEMALDPRRYFIVTVNLLGNGQSSSPSNTPPPFDRSRFPRVSLLDNVVLQRAMLAELWGIDRLALVIGRSMGAQVAYQWASYFPPMVDRLIAMAGSARTSPHNYVFLATVKGAILGDPAFARGEYESQPAEGLRQMRLIYDSWVLSQEFYRLGLHLAGGFRDTQAYLDRPVEGTQRDANNVLAQIATWQNADISDNARFGRDLTAALGAITARSIIMPSRTDLYFPPKDSEAEVAAMRDAELRVIPSIWGHRAGAPGGDSRDIRFVDDAVRQLLGS